MKTYTMDQIKKMQYQTELVPLHKKLVSHGVLSKPTSAKREYIEHRIFKALGKFDAN